ncbi:MAG: hypothetical protein KDB26_08145 [Microthrixaceae bacterium]|nr:hypothetical protein [Microthrixaceae bacterium]
MTKNTRTVLFVRDDENPTEAMKTLRASLIPGEFAAFDIETNALHPSDPRDAVTSIQIGSATVAVLLNPNNTAHIAAAREFLNDPVYRLTAHNAGFDILRLTRLGVFDTVKAGWERTSDTFILLMLLVQRNGKFGNAPLDLKTATSVWCGADAVSKDAKEALVKVQKEMGTKGIGGGSWNAYENITVDEHGVVHGDPREGNTWAQLPRDLPEFINYCAADVFDSAQLAATLDPMVRELWPERVEAEHHISRMCCEMTHRGVKLDRGHTLAQHSEACTVRAERQRSLEAYNVTFAQAKSSGVFTPSRESVAEAIRAEGIDVPRKLDGNGKMQDVLDKKALKKYKAEGSVVAQLFREWTLANRDVVTYYNHYLRTTGERVHAEIAASEAVTGRMASKSPNLQNVPETVKPCLVADDGFVLISADFSSVEMRVAAAVTGDKRLTWMYTEPLPENATEREERERDPYWLIAWRVWGPDATVDDRKLAKIIVLGSMYGGGTEALSANVDISPDLGQQILNGYRAEFPQLKLWFDRMMKPRIEAGRPFWMLDSGRFQSIDPTRAWAGLNMMIQGLARDLLLGAMFRLEAAGFSDAMLLPVHDEVLFQVPAAEADAACASIQKSMQTSYNDVPIEVEVKVLGTAWTEKTALAKPATAA